MKYNGKENTALRDTLNIKIALSIICMDEAIFAVKGRSSRPCISIASVWLTAVLSVSLFLITL